MKDDVCFGIGAEVLKSLIRMAEYTPKKIIVNGVATIVFWGDDTKTVVKWSPSDRFDVDTAFVYALAKKIFRSNSAIKKLVDRKIKFQNPTNVEDSCDENSKAEETA